MKPGEEGPDLMAQCQKAEEEVADYCAKHGLGRHYDARLGSAAIACGGRPLIMVVQKLIHDNDHLHRLIKSILEPVT